MPVRIYGATSGYVDVTVPDIAGSGTVVLSPSGNLAQVRQTTYSTLTNCTTTSYTDTGLTGTITPTAATSQILVTVVQPARIYWNAAGERWGGFRLLRDATQVYENAYGVYINAAAGASSFTGDGASVTMSYLDSPNTTSPVTYKTQGKVNNTANGTTLECQPAASTSVMILTEVVATQVQPPASDLAGMFLITKQDFSAASAVNVNNCFSSTYDNYRVAVRVTAATADGYAQLRMRAAGTDATTAYHTAIPTMTDAGAATNPIYASNAGILYLSELDTTADPDAASVVEVFSPALAARTLFTIGSSYFLRSGGFLAGLGGGIHKTATAYDGFTLLASAGAITGTLSVYGYRKA